MTTELSNGKSSMLSIYLGALAAVTTWWPLLYLKLIAPQGIEKIGMGNAFFYSGLSFLGVVLAVIGVIVAACVFDNKQVKKNLAVAGLAINLTVVGSFALMIFLGHRMVQPNKALQPTRSSAGR